MAAFFKRTVCGYLNPISPSSIWPPAYLAISTEWCRQKGQGWRQLSVQFFLSSLIIIPACVF